MKRVVRGALLAGVLLASSPAGAAGNSLATDPSVPTTTSGVAFSVSTGGNRNSVSVEVGCGSNYGTVVNVVLDADGNGTSQRIYPPAGSCTADLVIPKQIGRSRVLATITFSVT